MAMDNYENMVIGKRQTVRQLALGNVSKIILACDADNGYKSAVYQAAHTYGVPVVEEGSRASIASKHNVEVSSAVVAMLKQSIVVK